MSVESPLNMPSHQPQIMLEGQTGVGVEPMPFQQILLNSNYSHQDQERYSPESDDDESSSPSPHPSQTDVSYLEFNVKPEPTDSGTITQPTYRLLQTNGILDARQILQSHGLYEANQAAANYPPSSTGVTTVILPSEANLQHSFTHSRSIAGLGELPSGIPVYSPQTNGHLPQLPNSASSDSCSSDINSQKPFIYAKPPTSPSPYTANTERARAFNSYVKQLIESRMDCKVPISLQPKHLVDDIMNDAKKHFPEFESCTRKRIRTFLKSCRRSKKFRQHVGGDDYIKRSDSGLNMSPALGSSPDLTQIRPQLASSNQAIILPQFITQVPSSSSLTHHTRTVIPHCVTSIAPNNIQKIPTIPIAQHITHFNTDEFSRDMNPSPTNSDFGTHHTRRSSDSDDEEQDNGSTRPSTPHTLPLGSTTGSLHPGLQLAQLQNSQTVIPSPFLQRPLNGTPTLQQIQIPAHLLGNGQIMHTHSESSFAKLAPTALAQVNMAQNRKRPSPTIEDYQSKKLNGDVRNSLIHTLSTISPFTPVASSIQNGTIGEYPNFPNGTCKLSNSEQQEIQKMIDGYRSSATLLNKAASQLEKMLHNDHS